MSDERVTRRRKWPYIAAATFVLAAIGTFLLLIVVLEPPDSLADLKAIPLYKGAQAVSYQKIGLDEGRDTSVLTFLTPDPPPSVIDHYEAVLKYPGKTLISPDRRIINIMSVMANHEEIRFKGFDSGFPWFGPAFTTKMVDINLFTIVDRFEGRELTRVEMRYRLAWIK